jgi:hypothetical protein
MPTIRVDNEVYSWLKGRATPFEDSPNSVLRKIAGLDTEGIPLDLFNNVGERVTGRTLNEKWGVDAAHALYHRDGTFYENLTRFPGALFDISGYVLFATEADYLTSRFLRIGEKLNVPGGISGLPDYVRVVV